MRFGRRSPFQNFLDFFKDYPFLALTVFVVLVLYLLNVFKDNLRKVKAVNSLLKTFKGVLKRLNALKGGKFGVRDTSDTGAHGAGYQDKGGKYKAPARASSRLRTKK